MITDNFKRVLYNSGTLQNRSLKISDGSWRTVFNTQIYAQATSGGQQMQNITTSYANTYQAIGSLSVYLGIVIGSDDTPASVNDYKIKAPITTGISASGGTYNYAPTSGTFPIIVTQPITNTSAENLVVKEIGLCMGGYSSSNPTGFKNFVMLTRDNVDVTIAPSETKTFTINIDFDNISTSVS